MQNLIRLGKNHYRNGNFDSAIDVFQKAVSKNPKDHYCRHYLALCQDQLAIGNPQKEYLEAIKIKGNHPLYWGRWIAYDLTRGQWQSAQNNWETAKDIVLMPDVFHQYVARWAMHWANLNLTVQALDSIKINNLQVQALKDRLNWLYSAFDEIEDDDGNVINRQPVPSTEYLLELEFDPDRWYRTSVQKYMDSIFVKN